MCVQACVSGWVGEWHWRGYGYGWLCESQGSPYTIMTYTTHMNALGNIESVTEHWVRDLLTIDVEAVVFTSCKLGKSNHVHVHVQLKSRSLSGW